jgi:hypothetical protein
LGVGVDSLPPEARTSPVLTGSDLGKLGALLTVPDETSVNEYKLTELSDIFIAHKDQPSTLLIALHQHAREMLAQDRVDEAWKTLLAFNAR